ncbi:uncharacterized protein sS8_0464 [Methylocaldum marinum]|uniref:Uncharacterized protein n=1 Tax=Methylocaldum marinum TaxID=1432792 RepID=A0A286P458_9GAMM|nr:hypothetical protein [Methylocaldum marinum]BBA32430.1 uncharacterized protein sS8_0464 [Methylocaldum marinum]
MNDFASNGAGVLKLDIESLFDRGRSEGDLVANLPPNAERRKFSFGTIDCFLDRFTDAAECLFVRVQPGSSCLVELALNETANLQQSVLGGLLVGLTKPGQPVYWLPRRPACRQLDSHGRILSEVPVELTRWSLGHDRSAGSVTIPHEFCCDFVIWRFSENPASWSEELSEIFPIEEQGYFLWGSHTRFQRLANLYDYLIHGAVYDLRWSWPFRRRCYSENEAHALYTVSAGLERASGKQLYRLIQQQLVLSLLSRSAADGGWYHGIWTEDLECHYRLHASGVHVLCAEYARMPSPELEPALKKATDFLSKTTDTVAGESWFLHDSLERSEGEMRQGPFKWIPSRALGKSPSNMLVLNTHLDSSLAVAESARVRSDRSYEDLLSSAARIARRVIGLRTFEPFYRLLFALINLTFLPRERASSLPLPLRALKRVAGEYLVPRLPALKARRPRLVMPGGYIDRELTLRTWAVDYHGINLMDLVRYYRRFRDVDLWPVIDAGFEFVKRTGLDQRWLEWKGKSYALGFWAEALYHRYLASPEPKVRQWLAEAILLLEGSGQGMPPSLLGANAEAVRFEDQRPCPVPAAKELRVVNLSHGPRREYLVVNTADRVVNCTWLRPPDAEVPILWGAPDGGETSGKPLSVGNRSYLWGRSE